MATATATTVSGWGPVIARWAQVQQLRRRKLAQAAQIAEDLDSLVGAVLDAEERRGPHHPQVVEGHALIRQWEAKRTKLLAEAHAMEVGAWTAGY